MTGKLEGATKALDLAQKLIVLAMLPTAAFFFNAQKEMFGQTLEKQTRAFEQSARAREMDVDLTVKFFDILDSKRFACFDENKAPLLDIIVQQHNSHNKVQIGAEVYENLILEALHDQSCRVSQDAALVRKLEGTVPRATSAQPQGGEAAQPVLADNDQIKGVLGKAMAAEERRVPSADPDATGSTTAAIPPGANGWVAVGRYKGKEGGFTNFTVLASQQRNVHETGQIARGATLRARWPVLLRRNTSDTNQGRNLVLGLVTESTCATVLASIRDLRGQTWAAVRLEPACQSGDYT